MEQRKQAKLLQTHEVPFMVYNVPDIDRVVEKWTDEYGVMLSRADTLEPVLASAPAYRVCLVSVCSIATTWSINALVTPRSPSADVC